MDGYKGFRNVKVMGRWAGTSSHAGSSWRVKVMGRWTGISWNAGSSWRVRVMGRWAGSRWHAAALFFSPHFPLHKTQSLLHNIYNAYPTHRSQHVRA